MKINILPLFGIFVLTACVDDFQFTPQPDRTELSVLTFTSYDQFKLITSKINLLPGAELDAWEKENNFKSYRSVLADADKEWSEVENAEQQDGFLKKYQDVLSIKEGTLIPHIRVSMYQAIINREGIYQTGDNLNKLIGNFIATVKKDDFRKLDLLKITNGELNEVEGVSVMRYQMGETGDEMNGRTSTYYYEAEYYYNPGGCSGDRKAFLSFDFFVSAYEGYGDFNGTWSYGVFRRFAVDVRIKGQRRNVACNWNNYDNPLEWKDIHIYALGAHTTGYGDHQTYWEGQNYDIYPSNYSSGSTEVPSHTETFYLGDEQFNVSTGYGPPYPDNYLLSMPVYVTYYGMGKSQGIGDNWAVLYDY